MFKVFGLTILAGFICYFIWLWRNWDDHKSLEELRDELGALSIKGEAVELRGKLLKRKNELIEKIDRLKKWTPSEEDEEKIDKF